MMGATKRICEMIVQMMDEKPYKLLPPCVSETYWQQRQRDTAVPPTDKGRRSGHGHAPGYKQILYDYPGGSIPCSSGGAYANGGEIFVLDMGKPVRISDLAKT